MTSVEGKSGTPGADPAGKWVWSWRRGVAVALLALLFALTLTSSLTSSLRVHEPAPSDPSTSVDRPLQPLDAPVVLGLILVVGLMLPDIRRIRVGDAELEPRGPDVVPPGQQLAGEAPDLGAKERTYLDALNTLKRSQLRIDQTAGNQSGEDQR